MSEICFTVFFFIQQDIEHLKNLFEPSRVGKHRKSVKRKRMRPCWLVTKHAETMVLVMASYHGDYAHLDASVQLSLPSSNSAVNAN
jgi:hypothetical protein